MIYAKIFIIIKIIYILILHVKEYKSQTDGFEKYGNKHLSSRRKNSIQSFILYVSTDLVLFFIIIKI